MSHAALTANARARARCPIFPMAASFTGLASSLREFCAYG